METHERLCDWRGVAVEDACPGCGASGVKAYPSSATWHGGVGGQTLTQDVCDQCWGSGDKRRPWPNRREIGAKFQELAKRAASAEELEGARESVAQLKLLAANYSGRLDEAARALEDELNSTQSQEHVRTQQLRAAEAKLAAALYELKCWREFGNVTYVERAWDILRAHAPGNGGGQ